MVEASVGLPLHLQSTSKPILDAAAWEVQQGPFKGMTISEVTSWYGGDVVVKLIGAYEFELYDCVEEAIAANPNQVINVGCAEGYYAVGFALRLPAALIHAIDIEAQALKACEAAARANRVEQNLRLELGWSRSSLENLLQRPGRTLLFVDCEGCEEEMFRVLAPDSYASAEIIVECHDFAVPGTSDSLLRVLSGSHETRVVKHSTRDAKNFPLLNALPSEFVGSAMTEKRPDNMQWIYAKPRAK
jgi:precorrin-6B methylase 2